MIRGLAPIFSMNTHFLVASFTALIAWIPLSQAADSPEVSQAIDTTSGEWEGIVNIDVSVLVPDYREPWNAGQPSGGSGTGFLIGKNRFLTNAHVVSYAT